MEDIVHKKVPTYCDNMRPGQFCCLHFVCIKVDCCCSRLLTIFSCALGIIGECVVGLSDDEKK